MTSMSVVGFLVWEAPGADKQHIVKVKGNTN